MLNLSGTYITFINMNKSTSIVLSVIAVIIVVGGWYLYSAPKAVAPSVTTETSTTQIPQGVQPTSTTETPSAIAKSTIVTYSANGFSPRTVTIKKGDTVTFKSTDGTRMWVAVNEHPTHLGYDGTSRAEHCPDAAGTAFDQCSAGESFSFTFQKVGNFTYHNHANANDEGVVVVTE